MIRPGVYTALNSSLALTTGPRNELSRSACWLACSRRRVPRRVPSRPQMWPHRAVQSGCPGVQPPNPLKSWRTKADSTQLASGIGHGRKDEDLETEEKEVVWAGGRTERSERATEGICGAYRSTHEISIVHAHMQRARRQQGPQAAARPGRAHEDLEDAGVVPHVGIPGLRKTVVSGPVRRREGGERLVVQWSCGGPRTSWGRLEAQHRAALGAHWPAWVGGSPSGSNSASSTAVGLNRPSTRSPEALVAGSSAT